MAPFLKMGCSLLLLVYLGNERLQVAGADLLLAAGPALPPATMFRPKWHPLEPYLISAESLEDSSHKSIAFFQLRFSRQCRFASFPPFLSHFSIVDRARPRSPAAG